VVSAFNFPVAVWSWNALIAAVCGDCVVWRPSSETPLTAIATQNICNRVLDRHGLKGVFNLVIGPSASIAEALVHDRRIPLVSFTGSTEVGGAFPRWWRAGWAAPSSSWRKQWHRRNGRRQPDLVLRAVLFGAVGTAGQRCTTTRRLFLQRGIAPESPRR